MGSWATIHAQTSRAHGAHAKGHPRALDRRPVRWESPGLGPGLGVGSEARMIQDRPLIYQQEIREQPLLPVCWDIEPLIARGDRVVFFGEFATFKTFLMQSLALHLAAPAPWLGFRVEEQRRVLYVDEEMNERTMRRRSKRLEAGAGLKVERTLAFASRLGVRFDAHGALALLAYLRAQKFDPQVMVIDALRRVLVGDENEARDVAQFWRNLEPISRSGTTVIVTHHMNKPPMAGKRAARHRASGSTDILAGSDASFAVERVGPGTVKFTGIKSRDDVELAPFLVRLDDHGDRQGPVTLTAAASTKEPAPPADDVFRRPA